MEKAVSIAQPDQLPAAKDALYSATTDVEITAATVAVLACMKGHDCSPITRFYYDEQQNLFYEMRGRYDFESDPFVIALRERMLQVANSARESIGFSEDLVVEVAEILCSDILTLALLRDEAHAARVSTCSKRRIAKELGLTINEKLLIPKQWVINSRNLESVVYFGREAKVLFEFLGGSHGFPLRALIWGLLTSGVLKDHAVNSKYLSLNFGTMSGSDFKSLHTVDLDPEAFDLFLKEASSGAVYRRYLPEMDIEQANTLMRFIIDQVRLLPVNIAAVVRTNGVADNGEPAIEPEVKMIES